MKKTFDNSWKLFTGQKPNDFFCFFLFFAKPRFCWFFDAYQKLTSIFFCKYRASAGPGPGPTWPASLKKDTLGPKGQSGTRQLILHRLRNISIQYYLCFSFDHRVIIEFHFYEIETFLILFQEKIK